MKKLLVLFALLSLIVGVSAFADQGSGAPEGKKKHHKHHRHHKHHKGEKAEEAGTPPPAPAAPTPAAPQQ